VALATHPSGEEAATARSGGGRRSPRRTWGWLLVLVAAADIAADQLTKTWALDDPATRSGIHLVGPLWLVLTYNSGAAFGLGAGVTPVVESAVAVLVAGLLLWSRRASRKAGAAGSLGLGLLLGGALSNLGDRVFRHIPGHPGAVVDFIDALQVGHHQLWPTFNVADASIVVGAAICVVVFWLRGGAAGGKRHGRA
jgi:signal peptidase II